MFLEPISKSFEEDDEAGKLDKAEEIVGVVLPANEDPALPLDPGEEASERPEPSSRAGGATTTRSGRIALDTSHQHRRCSCPPSPRGRLRYAERLRRPR